MIIFLEEIKKTIDKRTSVWYNYESKHFLYKSLSICGKKISFVI